MGLGQLEKIVGVPKKSDWCDPPRAGPSLLWVGPSSFAGTLNCGTLELGGTVPVCAALVQTLGK